MTAILLLSLILGLRHGMDPDHLTAIDGLSRFRPKAFNGLYFALGHGLVVTALTVGIGATLAEYAEPFAPWLLILIGAINLWKLICRSRFVAQANSPVIVQPFLLGMLLAAGFETSSQLSVFLLASHTNPFLLGAAFTFGMVITDGLDGFLAASTQRRAVGGNPNAQVASQTLGLIVVLFSFGLGTVELMGFDTAHIDLPVGLVLFALVIATRVMGKNEARFPAAEIILERMGINPLKA
jgi:nickel/cobalt transporter (NiCoT) family protein